MVRPRDSNPRPPAPKADALPTELSRRYRICGKIYSWIKDFLKNRTQRVAVNGCFSSYERVTSGIPPRICIGTDFVRYIHKRPPWCDSSNGENVCRWLQNTKAFKYTRSCKPSASKCQSICHMGKHLANVLPLQKVPSSTHRKSSSSNIVHGLLWSIVALWWTMYKVIMRLKQGAG